MSYIEIIKVAIMFFPVLAFLFTIPYMLIQYHKYGSIHPYKTLIVYSFILYLLAAYLLVILPLPEVTEVAKLTTPRTQLIPFSFVMDFIRDSGFSITNLSTYLPAIKTSSFYVPAYNIALCMPFWIYLHYYFKCNLKKTLLITFLLSLFFELTQLTGLYFIYPRGYRLFDIDDLMINTLGGLIGYFIAFIFMKILPSKDEIVEESYELGKKVSFIRRYTVFFLDAFIYLIMVIITSIFYSTTLTPLFIYIGYYIIIPILLKGQTLGRKFLNIKVVSTDDKKLSIFRITIREVIYQLMFYVIPLILLSLLIKITLANNLDEKTLLFIAGSTAIAYFIYYLVATIKFIMKKPLIYERVSHTKIVSTIENLHKRKIM